jgi:predicted RNase H-like HicB family nuclease
MKMYDVIVERRNGVYHAWAPALPNISVEASSRDEAVAEAKKAIERFFQSAELTTVVVDVAGHEPDRRSPRAWLETAGKCVGDEAAMLKHIEEIYAERKRQREAVERELDIVAELNAPDPLLRPGSPEAVLRAAADCRINPDSDLYQQYLADLEAEKQRQRKAAEREFDAAEENNLAA